MTTDPRAALPLRGVTVVALEQAVAGPFATRQLADLGARVIKVERTDSGDFARGYDETVHGMSSYFVWLNRGKESVTLDLKQQPDRALLHAMLARADVLVQNLVPGAVDRLELDDKSLRDRYPRLITCAISGYGAHGPYSSKKAYDLLVQCEAGLLSVTGTPEAPAKVGISVADISAGMYAFSGVLTALYERERTGNGGSIEVAMLDALGEWTSQPYLYGMYGGTPPPRTGARHASISPYGPYRAAGGAQVFIGVQNEREWAVLCTDLLGRPELVEDPRFACNSSRVRNDAALRYLLEQALAPLPAEQVAARLDELRIANARMRTMAEFAEHPQLAARDRWRTVATPSATVRCLLPPVTVAGREAAMGAVPALGQHSEAVRAEFTPAGSGRVDRDGADSVATSGTGVGPAWTRTEIITAEPAEALAGLLDLEPPVGDQPLPPLWHWVYLLERCRQSDLGPDGHPRQGLPAPPGPGQVRMFAGGRVQLREPLRVGEAATRTARLVRTTLKDGGYGPLTFLTIRSQIEQRGRLAIVDEQDIVYRPQGRPLPVDADADADAAPPEAGLVVDVDPVVLFRFSALTYNAHRIHYDQAYAVREGYPDLVVHGPLQALLMGELMRRSGVPMAGHEFAYRLVAPAFGAQRLTVTAPDGPGSSAEVRDAANRLTATSMLRPLMPSAQP